VQTEYIAGTEPLADVSSLAALGRWRERLRVLSCVALTANAAQLFSSLRGVPLLVIEPSRAEA
jgi:hypothetical protein